MELADLRFVAVTIYGVNRPKFCGCHILWCKQTCVLWLSCFMELAYLCFVAIKFYGVNSHVSWLPCIMGLTDLCFVAVTMFGINIPVFYGHQVLWG